MNGGVRGIFYVSISAWIHFFEKFFCFVPVRIHFDALVAKADCKKLRKVICATCTRNNS